MIVYEKPAEYRGTIEVPWRLAAMRENEIGGAE